jgi:hypothetical protein
MKKKMKTFLLVITLTLFGFLLGTCGSNVMAEQTRPIKIWYQNSNGKMETFCVVDESTGVNYIVVTGELYSESVGTAITPRLNADGTLYTSK